MMKIAVALLPLTAAFMPSLHQQKSSATALHATNLPKTTGRSSLDPAVIHRYQNLPYPDEVVLAEYVWVDAVGNTRSKTRTLNKQCMVTPHQWIIPFNNINGLTRMSMQPSTDEDLDNLPHVIVTSDDI